MGLLFMITLVVVCDYVWRPFTLPSFTPYVNGFMDFVQLLFDGLCRSVKILTEN